MTSPYTQLQLDARAVSLAEDLARIDDGWQPDAADLLGAPMLSDYRVHEVDGLITLSGITSSHPRHGAGPVVTAQVMAAGPGWVRTAGRFYVVDDPASGERAIHEVMADLNAPTQGFFR